MDLLIALIPLLPLAGFFFAVFVGPRLDRVPLHGHGESHGEDAAHDTHDDHAPVDDSQFRFVPSEAEQAATSPHAGHADDLANGEGAAGVIPEGFNDGLGQPGASDEVYAPEWELFDLQSDPYELTSVYDDPAYAAVRQDLTAELYRQQREIGDRPHHTNGGSSATS